MEPKDTEPVMEAASPTDSAPCATAVVAVSAKPTVQQEVNKELAVAMHLQSAKSASQSLQLTSTPSLKLS